MTQLHNIENNLSFIDPHWIVGFVDGEGCFSVSFKKREKLRIKLEVTPSFSISQHERSKHVLEAIQKTFDCGFLRYDKKDSNWKYEIRNISLLCTKIIPFFVNHTLLTNKALSFNKFKEICILIEQKQHLTQEGIIKIIHLAFEMNPQGKRKYSKLDLFTYLGFSESSSVFFCATSIPTLDTPKYQKLEGLCIHHWWITGFTDGDGCFSVYFQKQKTHVR